jgi:hypothetical protein
LTDDPEETPRPDMPYKEVTKPRYAEFAAQEFQVEGHGPGTLVLRGPCPRCGTTMESQVVDVIFRSSRAIRFWRQNSALPDQKRHEEPMMCLCEDPHPDRPEGREGCGAYWKLTITVSPT